MFYTADFLSGVDVHSDSQHGQAPVAAAQSNSGINTTGAHMRESDVTLTLLSHYVLLV